MPNKLFLLDAMALVYRAHFALIARPIFTSKGVNTSALYGFTQTLLELMGNQQPTHLAIAFDTEAPTPRHTEFPEYKSHREAMPEDLRAALPHVRRMIEAFNIPILEQDGWEADDLIGTVAQRAAGEGWEVYMVTPDKDFGQIVSDRIFVYKPSRMGEGAEILGVKEIIERWGIQRTEQVADILGLMGDSSDNIPGVPGVGEKTASKFIAQFGTIENLLSRLGEVKGKMRETLEQNRELALLSKKLATLRCNAPIDLPLEAMRLRERNDAALQELCLEFEFNALGKRLFGEAFKAGRGFTPAASGASAAAPKTSEKSSTETTPPGGMEQPGLPFAELRTLKETTHRYEVLRTAEQRAALRKRMAGQGRFAVALDASSPDPREARVRGLAFCLSPGEAEAVEFPPEAQERAALLEEFRPLFEEAAIEKVGHDLKRTLSFLRWQGCRVQGPLFDTMLAHALIEPDLRHSLGFLAESALGYSVMTGPSASAEPALELASSNGLECAMEEADLAWQLRGVLEPQLKEKAQERVFFEIEAPLVPVLVEMEFEGIRLDPSILADFSVQLTSQIAELEGRIQSLAGGGFNLNSPKQLGEVLFERLKLAPDAKKTKTGQYATNEGVLQELAGAHEIVRLILLYREATKLKSTYVDMLPSTVWPPTGRIHTTFRQVSTATGRLASDNPNLQNIPIRSDQGREIRKAFVPRDAEHRLLSADYSQIELRIIAALSHEPAMLEAFRNNVDIHIATAARVYSIPIGQVTSEMRRKAKMVNYGLAYGMSGFGLAQRLGIPRREAQEIMDHYFAQFPGVRRYMNDMIEAAVARGYAETVTGRRRYLRDIRSSNATVRGAAERNAINAPIQGSAADMIKIAMVRIHREIERRKLKSRLLLQVHDELLFDLFGPEEAELRELVRDGMESAIPLEVPITVEMGVGENWLQAH